ncbi:MAG: hypothetical protein IJU00_14110 [Selenomonas sp.]|nr:hypothetical protein [Selenomonas sp.]
MEGKLKNCPYCHKVFVDYGEGCCPACREKQDAERQVVRDYLKANPGADMMTLARETGLSGKVLKRMSKEGFLGERRAIFAHPCRGCGKTIDEGIYCKACIATFAKKRADLASRRLTDNLRGSRKDGNGRREADGKFLAKTYNKYKDTSGKPLLKSDRLKQKRRESGGGFYSRGDIF